jgi:GMP synthase (glutamine-hydrolysing)
MKKADYATILVLDFGSQYTQLIARRIREARVYSEIVDSAISAEEIRKLNPVGLVLSGGPASVHDNGAPGCDPAIFDLGLPILGICYGLQYMTDRFGGQVKRSGSREYGPAMLELTGKNLLFQGLPSAFRVWMSHADEVVKLAAGFEVIAASESVPFAAVWNPGRRFWGVQFHPEVVHTKYGKTIIRNFARRICNCKGRWSAKAYIEETVTAIRSQVGDANVICGLSGGVDSAVAAVLIHAAIGDQLTCIFVDNGVLRHNEADRLLEVFRKHLHVKVKHVDARERFLSRLAGVTRAKAQGHRP